MNLFTRAGPFRAFGRLVLQAGALTKHDLFVLWEEGSEGATVEKGAPWAVGGSAAGVVRGAEAGQMERS